MILIDWSNVIIGSIMISTKRNTPLNEDYVRHLVLNSLRYYRTKYYKTYGELVICTDSSPSWRKDVFPNYKFNRKKVWETSKVDKDAIFEIINNITDELKEFFPYKVLHIPKAEGDDIIATIVSNTTKDKHLIVSADKDFIQLQRYGNTKQWSPINKKFIVKQDGSKYLKEHIIRGDRSDGIPNILSPDNVFIDSIRQKPIRKTMVDEWLIKLPIKLPNDRELFNNLKRNSELIDLLNTPKDIKLAILKEYKKEPVGSRGPKLFKYFLDKKLNQIINVIGEF